MQLWLSRESEVPLREQLTAQIKLAILSQDLQPGERLPSTRELARRFKIHANTVSAAYTDLNDAGWVEMRAGSGVYVRQFKAERALEAQLDLDHLIIEFLEVARRKGFSLAQVQGRVRHWLRLQPPDHFLVLDPEQPLREIIAAEIAAATGFRVANASIADTEDRNLLVGAVPVALYGQAEAVTATLPPTTACLLLKTRSIPEALKGQRPPAPDELISIVSHWPNFLNIARSVLIAVGLDGDALNFRDARDPDWARGLRSSAMIITDAATALRMPTGMQPRIFKIISDSSIAELKAYVEKFIR